MVAMMNHTYNDNSTHSVVMPAPCVGTLQKTHRKSQFRRFHVKSETAGYVFSGTPSLGKGGKEIVVLQIMTFGDNELLMEYVDKEYWEENHESATE